MKKMIIFIMLISVLCLGSTCNKEKDDCHKTIEIVNNSEKGIYVSWDRHYPDTLYFGHSSSPASDPFTNKVLAKSSNDRSLYNRDCWEIEFSYGNIIPSDTLMVYIFDVSVLDSVDWADVVHEYRVLKRYDLSLEDLQQSNWTVTYP